MKEKMLYTILGIEIVGLTIECGIIIAISLI
jgi:hypothetical protein